MKLAELIARYKSDTCFQPGCETPWDRWVDDIRMCGTHGDQYAEWLYNEGEEIVITFRGE